MKKILYFIIGAMLLTSCEDFLDSSNKTKKTQATSRKPKPMSRNC